MSETPRSLYKRLVTQPGDFTLYTSAASGKLPAQLGVKFRAPDGSQYGILWEPKILAALGIQIVKVKKP